MATVNIGGDAHDANFRYKRPKVQTKVEGRGNGIKTVIPNMQDLSRALHRPGSYITKFFGVELGAQSRYNDETGFGVVNGCFQTHELETVLELFIRRWVLCPNCNLPETIIEVDKRSNISFQCGACGAVSPVNMGEKLVTFILKNPPQGSKLSKKDKKSRKDERRQKKKKEQKQREKGRQEGEEGEEGGSGEDSTPATPTSRSSKTSKDKYSTGDSESQATGTTNDQNEDDDWTDDWDDASLSQEAVEARKEALRNELDSTTAGIAAVKISTAAIEAELQAFCESATSLSEVKQWFETKKAAGVIPSADGQSRAEWIVRSLFSENLLKELKKHSALLAVVFKGKKNQRYFLDEIAKHCVERHDALRKKLPFAFQTLYEKDIVLEPTFLAWDAESDGSDGAKKARKLAQPFITWLKTAESDESEDDDEEEDEGGENNGNSAAANESDDEDLDIDDI